jgi:phage terminase large subunit-like protein
MQGATAKLVVDLRNYRPTPSQARFLRSRDRFVLFAGGYGSGKTRAGAEKAVRLALHNPGCTGLMVGPTWQMTTRLTLDAFLSACPPALIREHHKSERRIELVNGSRIYFGSADKPGSLEGTNVAWAWLDEGRLVGAESWRTIIGRVRDRNARVPQAFVTTTPAMGWLSEFFDGTDGRPAISCSTVENAHNLAPGFVEQLRRSYSPRLAKSLIDGEFSVISGQVYEEFDEARHCIPWAYDPRLRLLLFVDFGVTAPAVLFAQETGDFPYRLPDGRDLPPRSIVVFDELMADQTPTQRLVPLVQKRLAGRRVDAIHCDPAGNARDQASGMPSVAMLRAAFGDVVRFETDAATRWIPNGIARVQGALSPVEGDPTLYVADALRNGPARGIVKALRGYRYPEAKDGRPGSDHPLKDGVTDHAMDALRYGVIGTQNARNDWRGGTVWRR